MQLRPLSEKDAPLMLEWMHDESVVYHLSTNFQAKTLADCQRFIAAAANDPHNVNLAVADDSDTYMGTVSLKHLDTEKKTAEFAITVRACAMGKGYSQFGMAEILKRGISQYGLETIYWCVSQKNLRAVRFYDKCGYTRTEQVPDTIRSAYTPEQLADFIWYVYPNP